MCSADVVVSQLQWFPFDRQTHRHHEWDKYLHSFKRWHCREQLRSGKCSLNLTLLFRFVFSCTRPRSNFLALWIHRLVCVRPNQIQRSYVCILALLHWNNLVDTFGMYPINLINLFTSRSQHKIFWQIPIVDIIPESSSFQDCSYLRGISDTWLAISSIAFNWSFSLSCSRSAFRIIAITFCGCVFNNVVYISGFIQSLSQTSIACFSKMLSKALSILQLFPAHTHSILITSSEHSICTSPFSK